MDEIVRVNALWTYRSIVDRINEMIAGGDIDGARYGYSLLGKYAQQALDVGVPRADLLTINHMLKPIPATQDGEDCTESCCA